MTPLSRCLELAAELRAGDQRAHVEGVDAASRSGAGTLPSAMRCARPSTIAVLPTPGSPTKIGLFLRRRLSTWIVRSSSLLAADQRVDAARPRRAA